MIGLSVNQSCDKCYERLGDKFSNENDSPPNLSLVGVASDVKPKIDLLKVPMTRNADP
jgi:hypothetical protein